MKKSALLIILCIFLINSTRLYSQEETKTSDQKNKIKKERKEIKEPFLFLGGAIWAGFGSYTFVDVNVIFGTQISQRINLGVTGKYQYYNDRRSIAGNFENNVYGGSIYSQIAIIKDFRDLFKVKNHSGIIAHIEYEMLNTKYNFIYFDDLNASRDRYWLNNVLIGGGYFSESSRKARAYIILLWNLTPTDDNPYEYPQLKIGFTFPL